MIMLIVPNFFYFILLSSSSAHQSFLYGDLGDENIVSVKKSAIPNVSEMENVGVGSIIPDEKSDRSDREIERTNFYPDLNEQRMHEVKSLVPQHEEKNINNLKNPLYEKNFISNGILNNDLGIMQKRNYLFRADPRRAPLSPQEVIALHAIKRIIEPSSAHERLSDREQPNQARNLIFRQHAVSIAKALRSPRIKSFLGINRPLWPLSSKNVRSNFIAGKKSNILNLPTINQERNQHNQYMRNFQHMFPLGLEFKTSLHQPKKPLLKSPLLTFTKNPYYNGLPFSVKSNPMIDKRMFSHGNFRIQSYPSETKTDRNILKIQGTPIKTFSEKKRVWLPYHDAKLIKPNAVQEEEEEKFGIKENSNLLDDSFYDRKKNYNPLKSSSEANLLGSHPMNWSGYKEYSAPNWLASLKRVIQPAESFIKRSRIEPVIIEKETSNASKKQLPFYHHLHTAFPVVSAFIAQPGQIPWNYYNPEYLPDGRVRPPLYPISKYLRPGTCLPESSLCDRGQHEQCCGVATICTDFWGISKCVAHQKPTQNDYHDPLQVEANNFYKKNYNYWLAALNNGYMK